YNIGLGAFVKSTALKRLNAGDRLGAADAIELWNKGHVNGKLVILPGLARRRAAERALFLQPIEAGPSRAPQLNTRLPPGPERGNQRVNLSDSRTIQGSAVAGGAGAVAVAGAASQTTVAQSEAKAGTTPAPAPSTDAPPPATEGSAAPPPVTETPAT